MPGWNLNLDLSLILIPGQSLICLAEPIMRQHLFFEAANLPPSSAGGIPIICLLSVCSIWLKLKPWLYFIPGQSLICLHSMLCRQIRQAAGCGGILIICPLSAQSTPQPTFHKFSICCIDVLTQILLEYWLIYMKCLNDIPIICQHATTKSSFGFPSAKTFDSHFARFVFEFECFLRWMNSVVWMYVGHHCSGIPIICPLSAQGTLKPTP